MENVFKAMGDALNPNCQSETDKNPLEDRQKAFDELFDAIKEVPDQLQRVNLMTKLSNYIYQECINR
ncbi:hypothetical protein UFOVP778_18 [uncultured Caudovirales phage]|uniref:Uncharacterized protein n=1 Tax=uncultured Caudovirales phage TaxID=2100421 RepID=A0A6J5NXF8_9CAUD|nr:hypothetical protein UFOVP778_18 [uncultured Caudovirales phage]